jgi:hypothetical protein
MNTWDIFSKNGDAIQRFWIFNCLIGYRNPKSVNTIAPENILLN